MSNTYYINPHFTGLAHDGSCTFAGILNKYFSTLDEYSREWNDNTAESYLNDYNNRILPIIENLFGLEKPISIFYETISLTAQRRLDSVPSEYTTSAIPMYPC